MKEKLKGQHKGNHHSVDQFIHHLQWINVQPVSKEWKHPQSPPISSAEQEAICTEYPFTRLGSAAVSSPASCSPWPTWGIEKEKKKAV